MDDNIKDNVAKILVLFEIEQEGQLPDPLNWVFGHHNGCPKQFSFLLKATCVQLIEAIILRGINPEVLKLVFDHHGHVDDMLALAIVPAYKAGKLKSLYHFALAAMVKDCYGIAGNDLLHSWQAKLIKKMYEDYHTRVREMVRELNVDFLNLEQKQVAAAYAAEEMVKNLRADSPVYEESRSIPKEDSYHLMETQNGIFLIELTDDKQNLSIISKYFYDEGGRILIFTKRLPNKNYEYSIFLKSPYEGDCSELWRSLSTMEPEGREWGGSPTNGGSPRARPKEGFLGGSEIKPTRLYQILFERYNTLSKKE